MRRYNLDDIELISDYNTNYSKKRHQMQNNISALFEELELEKEIHYEDEIVNHDYFIESAIEEYANIIEKQKYKLEETLLDERDKEECVNILVKETFAYIVYESLLVDDKVKRHNAKYIYEQATNFYEGLLNEGLLNFQGDSLFNDMVEKINGVVYSCEENMNLKDLFDESIRLNGFELGIISHSIKLKASESVKIEKEIANIKNDLMHENQNILVEKYDTRSLFRCLQQKNMQRVLTEKAEEMEKEDMLNLTMLETLLDYTLLESMYTTKLLNFNLSNLMNNVKFM